MADADGNIDITDTVEFMRSSFVTLGANFLYAALISVPYMQWATLPIVSTIVKWIISKSLTVLSTWEVLQAFLWNTALRKLSQAGDFVNSVKFLNALPPTVSEDEYAKAEQNQILAFTRFVKVSS